MQSLMTNLKRAVCTAGMESVEHLKHPPKLEGLVRWAEVLCSGMPCAPKGSCEFWW